MEGLSKEMGTCEGRGFDGRCSAVGARARGGQPVVGRAGGWGLRTSWGKQFHPGKGQMARKYSNLNHLYSSNLALSYSPPLISSCSLHCRLPRSV